MTNLDTTYAALGHPTRRAILVRLAAGETALSDLAAPFAMSQTAVSKHVRVLSDAGLVAVERRGRVRHCRLVAEPMADAVAWLEAFRDFWETNLDRLDDLLNELKRQEKP